MINAIFSNTNYDEDADARSEAIQNLEEQCNEVIEVLYNGVSEREKELDLANPFFAASERSLAENGVPELSAFPGEEPSIIHVKGDENPEYRADQS